MTTTKQIFAMTGLMLLLLSACGTGDLSREIGFSGTTIGERNLENSNAPRTTELPIATDSTIATATLETDTTQNTAGDTQFERPEFKILNYQIPKSICETDPPARNTPEWSYCVLLPEPVSLETGYSLDFFTLSWYFPREDSTEFDEEKVLDHWEELHLKYPLYGSRQAPRLSTNCEITPRIAFCKGGSHTTTEFLDRIIALGNEEGFPGGARAQINSLGESLGIVSQNLLESISKDGVSTDEQEALFYLIGGDYDITEAFKLTGRISTKVFPYINKDVNIEIEVRDAETREPISNAQIDFSLLFDRKIRQFFTDENGKISIPVNFYADFLNYGGPGGTTGECIIDLYTHKISADGYIETATRSEVYGFFLNEVRDTEINNRHLGLTLKTITDLVFLVRGSDEKAVRIFKNRAPYLVERCSGHTIEDRLAWERGYIGIDQYSIEDISEP